MYAQVAANSLDPPGEISVLVAHSSPFQVPLNLLFIEPNGGCLLGCSDGVLKRMPRPCAHTSNINMH